MSDTTDLVPADDSLPTASVHTERDAHLSNRARERIAAGVAAETRRAYARQWTVFTAWCESDGRVALPATAETLAEYVTELADRSFSNSTIEQAIAAVRTMHRAAGYKGQPDTEAARLAFRDYRRTSKRRRKKATPITIEALRAMVDTCDSSTIIGLRDQVVLVLGWALYGRRSELVALDLDDITETDDGLEVLIGASKTDQDAVGEIVAIPYGQHLSTCPVRVVRAWRAVLAEHAITSGRLVRSVTRHGHIGNSLSGVAVDAVVKARARAAGLPNPGSYAAHSLRAGGASGSYKGGAPPATIRDHGRWAEGSPVFWEYIRTDSQWENNPLRGSGL